jgi:cytochrome P450
MATDLVPTSDIDVFSERVQLDPYPFYAELRDLGALVRLDTCGLLALTRFDENRTALRDWKQLSSSRGVAFNERINEKMLHTSLGSDPPEHDALRGWYNDRLLPSAIRPITDFVERRAHQIADEVVEAGEFDAADVARRYVSEVITFLVGLPLEMAPQITDWSEAVFDMVGPWTPRAEAAMAAVDLMYNDLSALSSGDFRPGSVGHAAYADAESGAISFQDQVSRVWRFIQPAVHTTATAIATALSQLAGHPEQWALMRGQEDLVAGAYNEALRLDAPIQMQTRYALQDWTRHDVHIPAGERVIVMLGSANRDERHYQAPDVFDIRRDARDHLSFGHGVHVCVGAPLARLEIGALLSALSQRAAGMDAGDPQWRSTNVRRKLDSLPVVIQGRR